MWIECRYSKNKNKYYYIICFYDEESKKVTEHLISEKYALALLQAGCKQKERKFVITDVTSEGVK